MYLIVILICLPNNYFEYFIMHLFGINIGHSSIFFSEMSVQIFWPLDCFFSYYWILKILYVDSVQAFCQVCVCKSFLLVFDLSFNFLTVLVRIFQTTNKIYYEKVGGRERERETKTKKERDLRNWVTWLWVWGLVSLKFTGQASRQQIQDTDWWTPMCIATLLTIAKR